MQKQDSAYRQTIIEMTKNPMMSEFTGERIVQRLTEKDLIKLNKLMKKHHTLNISGFLRTFRRILKPSPEQDFYLTYGLFRLFQEICISCRKCEVTFDDISTIITQKMPSFNQDMKLSQKLYPLQFDVPDSIKKKIYAPDVVGKVMQQRERLQETPYLLDKFLHLNRRVGITYYSNKNKMFITNDQPQVQVKLLNEQFQIIKTLKTQQEISKRDSIITHMAWSEHQERLAILLGNYSISMWAKEDNYRFEVNVPLPLSLITNPYIMIGYLQCSKIWYTIDNHPSVYILSNYNFEPQYKFSHFKMIKQKQTQKILTLEIKYRKLLCLAFQRNIFLISLEKRELITQLRNFKTSITSIAFSQTFQALFVSNFQNYFTSYQLSEYVDLTEKGRFQGHKNLISIIGVLQGRPVVYSIDQKSVIKLWDIRDFQCYQSFSVLKNVQYRQVIALPQSICLIGSKHFCYRWLRFTLFKQEENVVYINQLEKNILIITGKEIRIYNHSNGVLMSVVKGIFEKGLIIKALLVQIRKFIVLMNDEGLTKIYSTKDFTQISVFDLLPKPHLIYYQKQTQLISFCSMGEVRISQLKQLADLPLKRRIHNRKEIIKFCKVSPLHDLITIQYEHNPYLFFYSYERAKLLGFLVLEDLVTLKLIPSKNVILVLLKDKLLIATFKKHINSISFFMKGMSELWEKAKIAKYQINFNMKNFSQIESTDLVIFQNKIVVTSNDACFHCILNCKFKLIDSTQVKINREYYNPYRIASEDHIQNFDISRPSVVIQQQIHDLFAQKLYFKHTGNKNFKLLSRINLFYCVADQKEVIFYNQNSEIRGSINFKQTLPLNWNLHNYSQEEFNELQFVLEFIQQQKTKNQIQDTSILLTSFLIEKTNDFITMNMLTPTKTKTRQQFRSMSLREKKMVLQKERDQKQKYQNYMEIRRSQELAKQKNLNSFSNQKYISESLAFLNINRNKLLLSKGVPEIELPQIRALQFKLNAVINKDDKKSIVSKYSVPQDYNSPLRKVAQQEYSKAVTKTTTELKLLPENQLKQSYKQQIKRLDLSLKQSKFKRPGRSSSLPVLKVV